MRGGLGMLMDVHYPDRGQRIRHRLHSRQRLARTAEL